MIYKSVKEINPYLFPTLKGINSLWGQGIIILVKITLVKMPLLGKEIRGFLLKKESSGIIIKEGLKKQVVDRPPKIIKFNA